MNAPAQAVLSYYTAPGEITRLEKYRPFLDWLTGDPRAIFQVVQGLLVHDMWIQEYGASLDWSHSYGVQIAYMEDLLDKALQLDPRSLALPRSPEGRVVCCCREFATLFCAMLRFKGIPARSRCGFGQYFAPGYLEDHWMCEYWEARQERWVRVDPQIDPFQQSTLKMDFSPLDLPPGAFMTAGEAWQKCRRGALDASRCGNSSDPQRFGLKTLHGLWFVRGQLLRDFAALNKVETVPFLIRVGKGLSWASWRLVAASDDELTPADNHLLDVVAEFTTQPDCYFDEIRRLYAGTEALQPPEEILRR